MKTSQAKMAIKMAMKANQPLLLVGKPGVGKTSLGFQAAEEEGWDVIPFYASIADPTDFKGFVMPNGVTLNFYWPVTEKSSMKPKNLHWAF